jgi:hypothetical protein
MASSTVETPAPTPEAPKTHRKMHKD